VHIGPDEHETLARIPAALRFPAPGSPHGHVVLGYDEHGRCPMLVDGGCSIYEHRPRTCRTYDCRIFPATGVDVGEDHPPTIQTRRSSAPRRRAPQDLGHVAQVAVQYSSSLTAFS